MEKRIPTLDDFVNEAKKEQFSKADENNESIKEALTLLNNEIMISEKEYNEMISEKENEITDFRLDKNSNIQVKVGKKWHKLITFTDDCPYGKYGYKKSGVNKAFNPYMYFKGKDVEKIEAYLRS